MAFSPAECWCSPKKMQVDYVDKPYYSVISEWDGFWPAGLCLTVKFWGENTCFLFWQQKILSRTQLLPTYWRQHLQQAKLGSWFVCFLCFESLHGPWSAVKRRLIWQTRLNIAHQEGQEVWNYIDYKHFLQAGCMRSDYKYETMLSHTEIVKAQNCEEIFEIMYAVPSMIY